MKREKNNSKNVGGACSYRADVIKNGKWLLPLIYSSQKNIPSSSESGSFHLHAAI
jgi:hypothetical protein